MSTPLLDIKNLQVTFPSASGEDVRAVDGVDLRVYPGEIHGLVGESGSGKSVTAKSIMRLTDDAHTTADRFEYDGRDLLAQSEAAMRSIRGDEVGIVFQDALSALNPVISVGEQIAEVVRYHGGAAESTSLVSELRRKYLTGTDTESTSWRRAVELLEMVGIPDAAQCAHNYPHQLSGGQRQRVMIAQALAGDPSLIIADEPTTALDVTVESNILQELKRLATEFDIAVLLITHDLGVVAETCDSVTVMYSGSVMERAPTTALFDTPEHPYTRGLIRSIPKYDSSPGEDLSTIPGSAPDPTRRPTGCPFRDRCEDAFDACTDPLPTHHVGEDHVSHCHLHNTETPGTTASADQSRPNEHAPSPAATPAAEHTDTEANLEQQ